MSNKATLARIDAKSESDTTDYGIIESAVNETARGRWFLLEYARRNRRADTLVLLESIEKLAARTQNISQIIDTDSIRHDLKEMAQAISITRQEINSIKPDGEHENRTTKASFELDSIVAATENATSDILEAAEHVQETAWTMREQEIDEKSCEKLDALATDIYTACSFQDITGQRTDKVIKVLQYLENRINGMSLIWGAQNWPLEQRTSDASNEKITSQSEIDTVLEEVAAAQDMISTSPEVPEIFEDLPEETLPAPSDPTPLAAQPARPLQDADEEIEDEDDGEISESSFSSDPAAINMSSLDTDDMHALFCC